MSRASTRPRVFSTRAVAGVRRAGLAPVAALVVGWLHLAPAPPAYGLTPASLPVAGGQEGGGSVEGSPLSPRHRRWLEEEVVYIITPQERAVFRMLEGDEERDAFIEAFWRARDPTPGTARNEFREEHYRRIEYANRFLGRETPRPGWRTDRGRVYIQLGEPAEVQRYPDPKAFWPMELWFYRADPRSSGLPAFFYVMFYRPQSAGEYRLYSPFADGPQALAKQISLQMANPAQIVQHLLQTVGFEVAQASVNLVPSERVDFSNPTPSLRNALLLHAIEQAPREGVDISYALNYAARRGVVEATVAFATLQVDLAAASLWDDRGLPFLHYALEIPPEKVLIGQYGDDYYLSLEVGVEATDLRGRTVLSSSQAVEEHFGEARARDLIRAPLAFYDRVDLVPGVYDLLVTVDNRVTNERAVARSRIQVPQAGAGRWVLSDLVVAPSAVSLGARAVREAPRAFRFGDRQLLPAATGRVEAAGHLTLFAQLVAPEPHSEHSTVELRASLVDEAGNDARLVHGSPVPVARPPRPTALRVEIPVAGLPPGPYTARLRVHLPDGGVLTREQALRLVPAGQQRRPEVLLASEAPPGRLEEYRTRGWQHLRKGELAAAAAYFRAGLERDPGAADLRRALSQVLVELGEYGAAVDHLRQMGQGAGAADLLLLSRALRLDGQPSAAAEVARRLLRRWPPTPVAWNALGEALLAAGDTAGAAAAYEASLKLDPDQPEIREALARIRGPGA